MTDASIATFPPATIRTGLTQQLCLAAALVGLADWLFYRHRIGISAALFALALGLALCLTNRLRTRRGELAAAAGILVAALLPVLEAVNLLSLLCAAIGLALFALVATGRLCGDWRLDLWQAGGLLVAGPFRLVGDVLGLRAWLREGRLSSAKAQLGMWIVPILFAAIFVALFAAANPLIESWLAAIKLREQASFLELRRTLFWLAALAAVWSFLQVRLLRGKPVDMLPAAPAPMNAPPSVEVFFGKGAILRSLVVFNLLFAVQTAMDLAYLWGGVALPAGMTYAAYAHRGAYPLIATALLAAGFVLAAMRPGGAAESSPLLRRLVYLWVAQNVLLVVSSILRLDLYVAVYSLTYWRIAAFIWMGLVAFGLMLIVARIALRRSNRWLVSANAAALALTLYACAFVNFPSFVATYNVAHREEAAARGAVLDLDYLRRLGPQAIPAMDALLAAVPAPPADGPAWCHARLAGPSTGPLLACRDSLAAKHVRRMRDWRAWTFRGWRLKRYLDERAVVRSPQLDTEPGS